MTTILFSRITTILFSRITLTAGWLMAPYWAWVSFAVLLNLGFWRLNRGVEVDFGKAA